VHRLAGCRRDRNDERVTSVVARRARFDRLLLAKEHLERQERGPAVTLVALIIVGTTVLYSKGRGLTFYYDEWNFIMNRREWTLDAFLAAHNEHLHLIPVVIYKLLFVTVGLNDYDAYRLVVIAGHVAVVALVFLLARRRVGGWLALGAAIPVLFLGSGWENILWPFQIGLLGSMAAGLGALLLLERRSAGTDLGACLLLAFALASSSFGIPIAIAIAVEVIGRRAGWARLWIVAAPVAVYGLWRLEYGKGELIWTNLPAAPTYVADAAAGAFAGLTGLGTEWGRPIALLAAIVLVVRLMRARMLPLRLLSLLAALGSFWALTALTRAHLGGPASSRYVYVAAVLIVLIGAELATGTRPSRRGAALIAVAAVVSVAGNYSYFLGGLAYLRSSTEFVSAELGALEIAGIETDPALRPDPVRAPDITAGAYFAATRELGSPAATPGEIATRPEPVKQTADSVLATALGVTVERRGAATDEGEPVTIEQEHGGIATADGPCVDFRPVATNGSVDAHTTGSGILVTPGEAGSVEVRLRRFAETFPSAPTATLTGDSWVVSLPVGRMDEPWHVRLSAAQALSVCGLAESSR